MGKRSRHAGTSLTGRRDLPGAGLIFFFCSLALNGQTLGNAALNGKYFFRHVSLGMDGNGNLADPRSLIGTMTFDGAGHYGFAGQQVAGIGGPAAASGTGVYAVDAAGFVTLENPQRTGVKVNGRVGSAVLLGSSTESPDNSLDLFAAIPAPTAAISTSLGGPFWVATLDYPGGSLANARSAIFSLTGAGGGSLSTIAVNGHSATISNGSPQTQQIGGATYVLNTDGTASVNFGSSSTLVTGAKTIYVSADGNFVLGGSTAPGAHDFLIGVKAVSAATAATWNGNFWAAGLRTDPSEAPPAFAWAGSVNANGTQRLTWTRRLKAVGQAAADLTGAGSYTLNADGSGTQPLSRLGLGAAGKAFVSIALDAGDPNAYELDFGARMTDLSGSGMFLNPQGIYNAASFAPAGNPISPGEFISLFGSGFATAPKTATPPYPTGGFNGITVLINGKAAPLYFVGQNQINALVPYATQGPTASIVVQAGAASSNTVTVPLAATSPGIFALDQSGLGPGAILHADFSVVNAAKPAHAGETIQIFLTGMGAVTPAVADGTAAGSNPVSNASNAVSVYVAGEVCKVQFNGLAPGFPGLYQINATLPPLLLGSGALPLALSTPNAFHDQVTIVVQ